MATTTFMFTDIEGSTRRWEESPAMAELVERHFTVLRTTIAAAGGEVFATLGDGVAAAFDTAAAAVAAAVDAQRALRSLGIGVRIGIHTGDVAPVGGDYRGRPVNRAARIMAVGHGGQVLVSDVTASLLRSGPPPLAVELADAGTYRLRDLTEPERLWQVVHPDLRRTFPSLRTLPVAPSSLPGARSSIVGRDADAARIAALVEGSPLVTLTGVGGVGKTRLALRVAEDLLGRYPGTVFVPLACVTDPDDVVDAIARAAGAAGSGAPAVGSILDAVGRGPALIVLDNCEHVISAAASIAAALVAARPQLRVVATSREALGIDGERVVPVRPLPIATDAVELFRQRAQAVGAEIEAHDRFAVEALCARLDGLPLAIELAAARAATLGVGAIAGALAGPALALRSHRRDVEARHSTMRATIQWSYDLLAPAEQRLFRSLGAFVNGFELDAVRHVAAQMGIDPVTATGHLESLVHKNMVTADFLADAVRFRMLETMRAFALDELDARAERAPAGRAMATWVATITGLPADDPCSADVERSAVRLEREADNWRQAMATAAALGSGELAAALCGPPADFFLLGRHDLAEVVRPLLACCVEPEQRRAVLCALVVTASGGTDPGQLEADADEVAALDAAAPTGLGALMRWVATAWRGDFAASVRSCLEAADDERLAPATRDLLVGIAVLDHFSLTDGADEHDGLIARAIEVAGRTDVALTRVTCLLGAAWGLAAGDPGRSVGLVRAALDHIDDVPAVTRLTLPGSASRLLLRLDPAVAAQALLQQLDVSPARRSFLDMVPLFYGAALLDRLGRLGDGPTAETVAGSRPVRALSESRGERAQRLGPESMMDFVDQARRAAAHADPLLLRDLEDAVRRGLGDVAGGAPGRVLAIAGA